MTNEEELEKICQKIIKMDPKIRSARIINSRGHLVAGGMKQGLQSLESQKQDEMMFMELALRVRMRHEFDKEFGEVHFSMSYRDKVIVMSYPLAEDGVLLVSTEKEADFGKIAFKILKLIAPLKKSVLGTF
jgi:predicted regulator of Ras-like GTPase activity (Roadblock/LC7/MglB family)